MKNKFLKVITAAVCVAFCSACMLAVTGCGSDNKTSDEGYKLVNEGKLTVASSLDFPPFENLENGEIVGYEVEIMKVVADKLGLELDIQNTKFDAIIAAVAGGEQFDCGVSGITINADRQKQVDFTTPVIVVDQGVAVVKGKYSSIDELKDKKIGVQSGTTGEEYAKESISSNVVPFDEVTACFAALQSGSVDAVAMDLPVVSAYLAGAYSDCEVIEKYATGEEYGIAINKDNSALLDAINAILAEMEEDGTLADIRMQCLGY